jgi:DNA-binding FadR family transcriptional regulator
MRKTATWMRQLDERLLEHLGEQDWSTPRMLAQHPRFEEMQVSRARIRERLQMLADAGLVGREHEDIYEITTWGQLYLEGELDAENQPRPRPGRVL